VCFMENRVANWLSHCACTFLGRMWLAQKGRHAEATQKSYQKPVLFPIMLNFVASSTLALCFDIDASRLKDIFRVDDNGMLADGCSNPQTRLLTIVS